MLELRRQQNRTNRIKLTISDRHRTLPITQIARRSILPPHPAPTRPWLTSVFIKSTISGVQSSRGVLRSSKSEKLRKCHSSKFPRGPRLVGPGSSWRPLSPSPTICTPHPAANEGRAGSGVRACGSPQRHEPARASRTQLLSSRAVQTLRSLFWIETLY